MVQIPKQLNSNIRTFGGQINITNKKNRGVIGRANQKKGAEIVRLQRRRCVGSE
jgi:hypothetical protein